MKSKEFLSTQEVAKICELSVGTVQKMADAGAFNYYITLGGHRRISATSVEAYLKGRDKQLNKPLVGE